MENYTKGKNVEEPLERDRIPIPNIPNDFLWMQVNGGSKLPNLLRHALGVVADGGRSVVWTGSGAGVPRAISCAEVMKRQCQMPYQITKIAYRKCEEFWEPKIDGLEKLVVNREVPIVHILLSLDPLNVSESGYQSVDNKNTFWKCSASNGAKKTAKRKTKPRVSADEITAMGLQSERNKGKKKFGYAKSKKDIATGEK